MSAEMPMGSQLERTACRATEAKMRRVTRPHIQHVSLSFYRPWLGHWRRIRDSNS
jgi:hypothetical protein